ncbi:hypothetical protein [Variovorax sp. ZT4R33]|uniref:hypothetical protein n=1 Tax=Variovorax sp. ZT4R33 TaxID=3443743 RepID=UPI003F48C54B
MDSEFPPQVVRALDAAKRALVDIEPAGQPRSKTEGMGLVLSSRTRASYELPAYYLVYFLFVDALSYPSLGQWEKSAWTVPIRYRGRLFGIEHRKMGLGIFAPNLEPGARNSGTPTTQAEEDAIAIADQIKTAVVAAEPYFQWRAEQAVLTSDLNVANKSEVLFDRYVYFRDSFRKLLEDANRRQDEKVIEESSPRADVTFTSVFYPSQALRREAKWNAQAAIEAFFSWTEHAFIHLAVLQGRLKTGTDVARLAEADWKRKFKAALDVEEAQTKLHYDTLLDLRAQVRNFVAHGAFGKRGEAFKFHTGAGAVPVLLTSDQHQKFNLSGRPPFEERTAIDQVELFLQFLWSGPYAPAQHYLSSGLPSILTYAVDGTYINAMQSTADMKSFINEFTRQVDRAANMEW